MDAAAIPAPLRMSMTPPVPTPSPPAMDIAPPRAPAPVAEPDEKISAPPVAPPNVLGDPTNVLWIEVCDADVPATRDNAPAVPPTPARICTCPPVSADPTFLPADITMEPAVPESPLPINKDTEPENPDVASPTTML